MTAGGSVPGPPAPSRVSFSPRGGFGWALAGYFFLFLSVTLFYIYPLYLERFGPSRGRVGLIMGVHSLLAILVRPVFGRLVDSRGGRPIALAGIAFFLAVTPWFHLVRNAGALPFLLRALGGVAWGISMTASMSVCADLAPSDRLARSIGIIGVAGIVASALGPMAAEEISRRWGFGAMIDASLVSLALALVCVWRVRPAALTCPPAGDRAAPAVWRLLPFGTLAVIAALPVIHGAVRGSIVNFIALFGKSVGLDRVGPFFFVFSCAAILTRLAAGGISDRYGRKSVIYPAAVLIALNLFWISRVRSFGMFLVNGFVAGLGQGLIFPALSTYIIETVGRERKGFALALYLTLFDVGAGLGSPLFGGLSDRLGYRTMYVAAGVLLLAGSAAFAFLAPRGPAGAGAGPSPPEI